jgi:hypothetical protein
MLEYHANFVFHVTYKKRKTLLIQIQKNYYVSVSSILFTFEASKPIRPCGISNAAGHILAGVFAQTPRFFARLLHAHDLDKCRKKNLDSMLTLPTFFKIACYFPPLPNIKNIAC